MLDRYKKIIVTSLLVVLVAVTSASVLLAPRKAQAIFGVGDITTIVADIPGQIKDAIEKGLKVARDITFRNQLNQFLQNLAYNAAIKLATGDNGQKPLFEVFSGKKILESLRDQSIGEFSTLLLNSTNKGTCESNSSIQCRSDAECPLILVKPDGSEEVIKDENDKNYWLGLGASENDFKGSKCNMNKIAQLGGIDICRIQSPAAEIQIKNIALNLITPPKPACTYNDLKENFENLKNIDTGGLVKVRDIYNQESNDLGIILNLTTRQQEIFNKKKAGEFLDKIMNGSSKPVKEKISGKTKTQASLQQKVTEESFIKSFDSAFKQTGSLVADAIGTFTNTFASKMLKQIFDKGLTPDSSGIISNRFFGGLSGIAAAKLKFADLLKLTDIKSQSKSSDSLLQDFVSGCSDEVKSTELGNVSSDALREVNNCIIDENFKIAIERKLTVREALKEGLLSGIAGSNKDFGVHSDGTGAGALAGTSCQGCDANLLSLRSILVLRKYRVVPVGWELAARYIQEILQKADPQPEKLSYNLFDLAADREGRTSAYADPKSPFYRLIDPDWQLKAPVAIQEVRGPGERIISDFTVRDQDTNNDGQINGKDEPSRVIQRGAEPADEQTCIYENADGSCAYFGYCTEEKPIWRIAGQQCNPLDPNDGTYNTCQTFIRGLDNSKVTYLDKSVDEDSCKADNVGCRRFATNRDPNTFEWINSDLAADNIFIDRDAPKCNAQDSGCSEFLRLTNIAGNILTAPEVNQAILDVQAIPGEIDDYRDIALVETLNLNSNRIDCIGDLDGDGIVDDIDGDGDIDIDDASANVACRNYTPRSFAGSGKIPGVVTAATIDSSGVIYNDECPAECVGYQPYEETAADPLYPNSTSVNFIADSAQSCSVQAVGCTEFTNLNEVAQGGEGLEYYTSLRECRTEDFANQTTYFTWEGSDESGFQLRSWQLVPGGANNPNANGPQHSGDDDYDLCTAAIFNLPPDDPEANPDCREYIDTNLNRYYALHSRVIFVTNDCQPLRRTLTDVNYDGVIDATDCSLGGGDDSNFASQGCIYFGLPDLSQSCSAGAVQCRQYKGFGSGNTRIVLNDTFEDGTIQDWSGGSLSNESVLLGGHSLDVTGGVFDSIDKAVSVSEDKQYILNFWAKGPLDLTAILRTDQRDFSFGTASLGSEWKLFPLGPVTIDQPVGAASLVFDGFISGEAFLDNIELTESNDLYLISKSWSTPNICAGVDETGKQVSEPQLYCEEYRDDQNQTKYIKKFTRLCEEKFVGCEALVNTYNSDAAEELNSANVPFLAGGPTAIDDVTVPADDIAYLVNDEKYYCSSSAVGCTELGLMTTNRDNTIATSTQYRILDPEQYETSLCTAEGELCESYSPTGSASGFPQFFKDPLDRLCEYKSNVLIPGDIDGDGIDDNTLVTGWFRVDASPLTVADICQLEGQAPAANLCNYQNGDFDSTVTNNFGRCNGDPAGLICQSDVDCLPGDLCVPTYPPGCYSYSCPAELSSCSEFQDPITPTGCDPQLKAGEGWCGGVPVAGGQTCSDDNDCIGNSNGVSCEIMACDYYYFLRDTLDSAVSECRGQIDPGAGCVGFYETDRGDESKFLRAQCQTGCQLVLQCYNKDSNTFNGVTCSTDAICGADVCRGVPVREFPDCTLDPGLLNPNSKPGCVQ